MSKILVIGSANMDLVTQSSRFAQAGETCIGERFSTFVGGKGANQAVAAARLGAQVHFIGAVGNDSFGQQIQAQLRAEHVDISALKIIEGQSTGIASITVAQAENHIIVVSGANFSLTVADICAQEALIASSDVILSQLEIPLECVLMAARLAKKHQVPFILNPAPAQKLSAELLSLVTLITPNEYELAISLGLSEQTHFEQLMCLLPHQIVMTAGTQGAYFMDEQGQITHQTGFVVDAVDSTGAGDTFNAALAVFYAQGLAAAVRKACAAGALSVMHSGAQSGMPTQQQLDQFLLV